MHKTLISIILACLLFTLPTPTMGSVTEEDPGLIRRVLHAFNCCGLRTKANLEVLRANRVWSASELKTVKEALYKVPLGGEKACVLYLKKMAGHDVCQGGKDWMPLDYSLIMEKWFLGAETFPCLGTEGYQNKAHLQSMWVKIGYQDLNNRYKFLTVAEEFRGDANWDSEAYYNVFAAQVRVPAKIYDICVRLTKQIADADVKAGGVKWTGRDILDVMTALSKVSSGEHEESVSHAFSVAEGDLRNGAKQWSPEYYALFIGAWFKEAPTYEFLGAESHKNMKFRKKMCQVLQSVSPEHRSLFMSLAESIRGDKTWKAGDFMDVFKGLGQVIPGMHETCVIAAKKLFEQDFARNHLGWGGYHYGKILEALAKAPEGAHDLCISHAMSLVWSFPACPHTKRDGEVITYSCGGDIYIAGFMYPPYIEALAAIPSGGLEDFVAQAKRLAETNRWCINNFSGILRALGSVPLDQHDLCVNVTTSLPVYYWRKWDYESLVKTLGHLPKAEQDQYIEKYKKETEGKHVWGASDAVKKLQNLIDKGSANAN